MEYRKDDLIILGMGASRRACPFDGAPVWSCNDGYIQIAEMTNEREKEGKNACYIQKVFMSHPEMYKKNWVTNEGGTVYKEAYNIEQMNMLIEHGIEFINTHRCHKLKAKLYPLDTINRKFKARGFFSDTIAYMIAYALHIHTKKDRNGKLYVHDGFKKIRIYGVDMLTKDEYELEKGGIEYWIGYAQGLGIEVEIAKGSAVCTTCTNKPYGVKHYNLKDIDPWGLLQSGKKRLLAEQAGLNEKQSGELGKVITGDQAEKLKEMVEAIPV